MVNLGPLSIPPRSIPKSVSDPELSGRGLKPMGSHATDPFAAQDNPVRLRKCEYCGVKIDPPARRCDGCGAPQSSNPIKGGDYD